MCVACDNIDSGDPFTKDMMCSQTSLIDDILFLSESNGNMVYSLCVWCTTSNANHAFSPKVIKAHSVGSHNVYHVL